jgi:preprotein translocase subunit SecE
MARGHGSGRTATDNGDGSWRLKPDADEFDDHMAKTNPGQFVRQVRQELSKVSWPSRKETGISTLMVFVMVFLAALFFFLVDQILAWGVQLIFGLGG